MLGSREREALAAQLAAAQERIAELESELARQSSRDRLGHELLSLPKFRAHLELDVARAKRHRLPLTVLLVDLDGFRALNAHHGYETGDAVLAMVGALIATHTRADDLACRTAGDEFAIVLHETGLDVALPVAQRLLAALEELGVSDVHGVSASIGAAGIEAAETANGLLATAGAALAQARDSGGGRVVASGQVPGEVSGSEPFVAVLASALEERDQYTGEHSVSLIELVTRVAEALALSPAEVGGIRTAALLHDIGKIGVPDAILHKAGPLDDREWEIMREHPVIGERILRAIPGMGPIARIVRHEHERWDGGGYPDGLEEESIPLGSRIILACDAYHAMVSDRPYRAAMPHSDAVAELTRNAGSQFDRRVVESLVGYLYGRRQSGLPTI